MDFNESIRFAAVSNKDGEILWHSQRKDIKNIVPLNETKKLILRAIDAWKENLRITSDVGFGLYTIVSYEKIKRITVPLDGEHLLFMSVNNEPLTNTKSKSYGKLVEMGKVLSIVEFVKSKK